MIKSLVEVGKVVVDIWELVRKLGICDVGGEEVVMVLFLLVVVLVVILVLFCD